MPWDPEPHAPCTGAITLGGWTNAINKWTCSCGFGNRPSNMICGGVGGVLGCKKPRAPPDAPLDDECADWVRARIGGDTDAADVFAAQLRGQVRLNVAHSPGVGKGGGKANKWKGNGAGKGKGGCAGKGKGKQGGGQEQQLSELRGA
eukprot:gene27411-59594_t